MKKKVVLFGGELFNKGSQAMTFVAVDEMEKRFPDHDVVLFSRRDYNRDDDEKKQYRFTILPFPRYRTLIAAVVSKRFKRLRTFMSNEDNTLIDVLHSADYILDISGYALGSDWGNDKSIYFCLRVLLAKKCGARVFLMPQSFGPFDYKGKKACMTMAMIKRCLPYAERIMAREEEGYSLLKSCFGLKNVVRSFDMVLQNREINTTNIYWINPVLNLPEIKSNAVGIIPNTKTVKFGSVKEVISIYDTVVEELKAHHKRIYFLPHCVDDQDLCLKLYDRYKEGYEDTFFLDRDMSCLEFDQTVSKFDFIVASRYHSIVHAYRNAIPAIVLGWAVKYSELMNIFGQENYHFNVRESLDSSRLKVAVTNMMEQCEVEKSKIMHGLEVVQKENVFDYIQ